MLSSIGRVALCASAALFLLAGAASAQPAPPPDAGAPAHGEHWRDPAERQAHMAARLRDVLQLQPGQEGALDAFLASMKPPADMAGRGQHEHPDEASLTTPQRLDHMMAHLDEMRARMAQRVAATKQFYAQLSPEQQKAFDALAPMMMRHFGGGHGGMGEHHGDGDAPHRMGPDGPPHS